MNLDGIGVIFAIGVVLGVYLTSRRAINIVLSQAQHQEQIARGGTASGGGGAGVGVIGILLPLIGVVLCIGLLVWLVGSIINGISKPAALPAQQPIEQPAQQPIAVPQRQPVEVPKPIAVPTAAPHIATSAPRPTIAVTRAPTIAVTHAPTIAVTRVAPTRTPIETPIPVEWPILAPVVVALNHPGFSGVGFFRRMT